jgi:hypothetical protein
MKTPSPPPPFIALDIQTLQYGGGGGGGSAHIKWNGPILATPQYVSELVHIFFHIYMRRQSSLRHLRCLIKVVWHFYRQLGKTFQDIINKS